MRKLSLELKAGALLLLMVGLLVTFLVLKGQFDYRRRGYEITVAYDYVAGIERGSPVRVSGVRVGEVRRVEVDFDEEPRALVTLYLDESVTLGRQTRFLIRSSGIIGEKYVEVAPAPLSDTPWLAAGETVTGVDPIPMERLMALGEELGGSARDMVVTLDKFFGDPRLMAEIIDTLGAVQSFASRGEKTLADISTLAASLDGAVDDYRRLAVAGQLLVEDGQALVRDGRALVNTVDAAAVSLRGLVEQTGHLVASSHQLVEENRPLVNQSLMNLQLASAGLVALGEEAGLLVARLQSPEGTIGRLVSSPEMYRQLSEVIGGADDSLARLRGSLEELGLIIEDVRAGRGSVGKLLYTETLSDDIQALVHEATALFSDIRARPWTLLFRPRGQR